MAKKNFYAIKKGKNPETGEIVENIILTSWEETQKHIKGVSGVEFAGFVKREEAEEYLGTKNPLLNKKDGKYSKDGLHCYVDGSFSSELKNYSYSLICLKDDKIIHSEKSTGNNKEATEMQQIAGELLGAMRSVLYTKANNEKKVTIFHDYVGTCYHAIGYWDRGNSFSEIYYDWMQKFFKDNPEIVVEFCKVDAHDKDDFNELADGLAKLALEIKPNAIFYKMAEKHNFAY